ncbi:MAG: hypothetical protein M3680_22070 [Myxococcota bacterium]|nr:hypothetical protein [Myxococcota bacterium]
MRLMILLVLLIGGCAHDVRSRYPAAPDAPTGTLVLLLSQSASGVSVAVNGLLVVEDARTEKIVIENIPTGTAEVAIAANGGDKQVRVWITSDHPTTLPMGVPEATSSLLKSIFATLVSITAYSLLN